MDLNQIEREILALIVDVKPLVAGLFASARDMPFDARRNIDRADLLRRSVLQGRCCYLWQSLNWWMRMGFGEERCSRR